jgi:hypothetical protein
VTPGKETEPGLIVYRFGADLFYANHNRFTYEVRTLVEHAPTSVHWFARGYLYETSSCAREPAGPAIARAMYRSGDERLLSPLFRRRGCLAAMIA